MKNIVVISDTHSGCKFGLYNPDSDFALDNGGSYVPSDSQLVVWDAWEEFWDRWVPKVTKNEKYVVVHVGDCLDGNHHGSTTQITANLERQREISYLALAPRVMKKHNKKCAAYYHLRGTESHVGPSAENEEEIAKRLKAIPQEDTGNHSRWEMWARLDNNALIHFSHHIGTTSSSAYESTAVYKEMVEAFNEAGRWRHEPPDVIVRAHRHRQFETRIATKKGYGISIVTPGWQLKTPFVYRLASGRASTPQIGGYLIRAGDEDEVYTRFFVKKLERTKEVVI